MKKNITSSGLSLAAILLGMAAVAAPSFALTPPALKLVDNLGDTIVIDSTGTVTTSGSCTATTCKTTASAVASGSISWSGTIGPFSVFNLNGQTKPALPQPVIDVGVADLFSASGGTLTVSWTDVGFDGSAPATINETTTINGGTASVTYTSYVDNTDAAFGMGVQVATLGPITTSGSNTKTGAGPTTEPFSMTNVEVFTLGAGGDLLNDYNLQAAPIPPLTLSCMVASGQVDMAYNSSLVVNGGVSPYTFSIIAGSLPGGLMLNSSSGAITGTPSAPGTFNFTAQVVDSSGVAVTNTASTSCGITIASPPPTLTCQGTTTATVGAAYSSNVVILGGVPPYMFSIATGALPTGLFLNATTGSITGTPSAQGAFSFTVKVLDSAKPTGNTTTSPSCGITVAPPPPAMYLTCAGSAGTVGTAYSSSLVATGGTKPYTFSITAGPLPGGLTLNSSTGLISGTPTTQGTFPYTFKVVDSSGNTVSGTATKNCSIGIVQLQTVPLSITCPTAGATVGVPYSSTPVVVGGVSPYTFSISAGALPAGLTLNANGTITGTPTTAGTSGFTIKVVDSKGTVAYSTCTGTCSTTTTPTSLNYNYPTGNLGNSHIYTVSGISLPAYGYTNAGAPAALDGQNNSGVQNDGLGINSVSGGQIDTNNFVQIDLGAALAAGATNGQLLISGINQCQNGESYDIYGSNTPGSIGTNLVSGGTKDSTYFAIPSFGTYRYISVRAHYGNVLLGDLSFNLPGPTCIITVAPAPAPKLSLKKTANVTTAAPFSPVTYTYVVTNTGSYTLTNVVVTDDNATPSYTGDDFTVGTIASLAPGASATLTATVIPPVSESGTPQNYNSNWGNSNGYGGWGNNYGGYGGYGQSNGSPAGTLICSKLSNGNYQITWRQDPGQTDNTYGRGSSSSWAGQNRTFSQMLSGQAAEFQFLDSNGNCVLDISADYISQSKTFPSGYGSLGVTGGNGSVNYGSGSHVVSCTTTLSHNLNQSSSFYQCTTDSPTSSSWDNVSGYTIVVDSKTFGSGGWGGVAIPDCHNQNSIQQGCGDIKVSPTSSSATNTATATTTYNGVTVAATAQATVQISTSQSVWSQCNKY